MGKITIKQEFNAPVHQVFEVLAKHSTYNQAFAPLQVVRVKDSKDENRPDGVGSVRRMGFGSVKPLQEIITKMEQDQLIEYKLIRNPLIKHHLGRLVFQSLGDHKTLVTYTIELKAKLPFLSKIILAQLKVAIKLGFAKLAKSIR